MPFLTQFWASEVDVYLDILKEVGELFKVVGLAKQSFFSFC